MQSTTLQAALWMTGAIASFTLMAIAGRAVSFELDTFEIMLFRSLIGFAIVMCVASAAGTLHQVQTTRLRQHTLRNVAHFCGQNLWFYAITVITLPQVFALEFTAPIWVLLLSPLFLDERIRRRGVIAALLGLIGVLIVTRPNFGALDPGLIAAALAAVAFAITAIFTKRLTRTESITCIMFWLTLLQAVFGLICAGFDGDIALPSAGSVPWVVLIACCGLLAHFCLTRALSIAPATIVMPMDFVRLPVIILVSQIVYGQPFDALVLLGGCVIFLANWINISAPKEAKRPAANL